MPQSDRRWKQYQKIAQRRCKNVSFNQLCSLLELFGWVRDRVARSNHYIHVHDRYEGFVNVPKPHQGRDVRSVYCREALRAISEVEENDE